MSALDYFPFPEFRDRQDSVIKQAQDYFENGIEVIIIEGPTGFGKSPVNIALGRFFAKSFYTTPQSKLVEQLAKDFGPKKLIIDGGVSEYDAVPLLARKKYHCKKSGQPSDQCHYYRKVEDHKCSMDLECTYWVQKQGAFDAGIAITTFSNLIVNRYLPVYVESEGEIRQISYNDRKLLIIDECHSLEEQVASLHAGFVISPNIFPGNDDLKWKTWSYIQQFEPKKSWFSNGIEEYKIFLEETFKYVKEEYKKEKNKYNGDRKTVEKYTKIIQKIEYLFKELEEDRKWIVNIRHSERWDVDYPEFKPIRVDRFLKEFIWAYADKYLLTSATIHYRNDIETWLERIGLEDKTYKFISLPMSFPVENRPIYLDKLQGALTSKLIEKNWESCVKTVKEIMREHPHQRGVIHCSSYKMMWNLFKELKSEFSIFVHNKDKLEGNDVIDEWIQSKKEIIISPSIYEGIDLKDDLCRFQILFKVPYAHIGDQRVSYLLNKNKDWTWYNNEAALKIIQAYGRAVRHQDDFADFYIIDGSFSTLFQKVEFPKWFKEAIQY